MKWNARDYKMNSMKLKICGKFIMKKKKYISENHQLGKFADSGSNAQEFTLDRKSRR